MEQRKVIVTISAMGQPKIETVGFVGDACLAATAHLEKVLAESGEVDQRYLKPEINEGTQQEENLQTW